MKKEFDSIVVDEVFLSNFYRYCRIVVPPRCIEDFKQYEIDEFNGFHATKVVMVEVDDEYLCGMRANHFVVEIGVSEHDDYDDNEENVNIYFLVSANHKGMRLATLFRVSRKLLYSVLAKNI